MGLEDVAETKARWKEIVIVNKLWKLGEDEQE
jgi:hypothetical protein